ncbi:isochorismate synthase [Acinetobacter puyangensis]|uniref:isochorismate synthase n=1 Tax=Acinetobacter puyangensis TaxID=1096779 RepID=UPI003A4E5A24
MNHPELTFQQQLTQWLTQSKLLLQQEISASNNHDLIIVGGLPFDARDLPELSIAEASNTHVSNQARSCQFNAKQTGVKAKLIPAAQIYTEGVSQLVDLIHEKKLKKAVLARAMDLSLDERIDIVDVFCHLLDTNPEGYTFALSQQPQKQGWFMGASPELLIAKQNEQIFSHPVAGTLARHPDQAIDNARAAELLASAKDQHEHAMVIEAIADQLTPFCKTLHIPKQPALLQTQTLWHLATKIQGTVKDPDLHIFDLVSILHPTPAVCGEPAQLARELIASLEPFHRSLFAGAIGWSDAQGNGAWSVTVRCGRIFEQQIRLYAGAGIVSASKPELELNETAAKFQTMLNALGLKAEQLIYI